MSDNDHQAEFEHNPAMLLLLVESLFFASLCFIAVTYFTHRLKLKRQVIVQKKDQAKHELTRMRRSVVVKPPASKAGPDPIDVTDQSKGAPHRTPKSETPPNAMLHKPGAQPGSAPSFDEPGPDSYKLALEHTFIASLLASMAHPTGLPPPAALPLTIYSPSEAPIIEKDVNGNDIIAAPAPAKLVRRSSVSVSSDPAGASAGASGDMDPLAKKKHKHKHKGRGPAPSCDPTIARAAPGAHHGHGAAHAPVLKVGPPPIKTKSEMAQSDPVVQ